MMFLLQQGPAETTDYMILGFVVIFGAILGHVWSLNARRKNMEKELELLKELDE